MTQVAQQTPITEALAKAVADTYAIAIMAQAYHWNVTGQQFFVLHGQFEEQYTDAFGAVDDLAERLRALGRLAPAGFEALRALTSVAEPRAEADADEMVRDLLKGHETVAATLKEGIAAAEAADDAATADLLTGRLAVHDKTAWMLRSHLG